MAQASGGAAIVTGASRGIGAAIAHRLAADGFAVLVNDVRGEEAALVVRAIEAAGGRAVGVQADVGSPGAVSGLFDEAERAFGGVDVLVNNAGILRLKPIAEVDDATFEAVIGVNLAGTFRGLREGARRLRDGGRIVSLSSSTVASCPPGFGVYVATKAAIEALTQVLAKELGPRGITVNAVAPGPVATGLFLDDRTPAEVAAVVGATPLGRLGEPADVAGVVSFLAGPDGAWVSGQTLRANGGRS